MDVEKGFSEICGNIESVVSEQPVEQKIKNKKIKMKIGENRRFHMCISFRLPRAVMNLHNRTTEERRRQTLCDKRDNNYVWNIFQPNFTFL